ncbi:MAG: sugar transferase [Verrucomicrobiota bacterium]|jgi:lipopolysaccharide/colanic/teichoic acid biosynthesis glycosyltransferase|nr:sugar transferase [Verrucomicrobiota bacterium]
MVRSFIARKSMRPGEVLALLAESAAAGIGAVVPATCLPVLARAARCKPAAGDIYVFPPPAARGAPRCGWGERAAAAALLCVCAPLLTLTALLVLALDGRPVLFRQLRFGCDGVPFTVFKFRTMKRRSERLDARLQRRRGRENRLFKLERDPRVTRLGALLRRTFIDELPQLLNVARGEMRLVGPRPLPASDQRHYTQPGHDLRLRGMPGMTGLWQVSGRNRLTFDEMCLLDCYYLGHRSLRFDLALMLRTAGVVFKQAGLNRKPEGGPQQPGGAPRAGAPRQQRRGEPPPARHDSGGRP